MSKKHFIKIVPKDSLIYNAKEAPGHETGYLGENKPKAACVYSVYSIGTELAQWQCENAWGQILEGSTPIANLVAYSPNGGKI